LAMSLQTPTKIQARQWKLVPQGEDGSRAEVSSLDTSIRATDHRGPWGEANRKAECRKSARSV
jgi:hypothetical protein